VKEALEIQDHFNSSYIFIFPSTIFKLRGALYLSYPLLKTNIGWVDDNALQYLLSFKMKDKLKIFPEVCIHRNMRAIYLPYLTDFGL
jgi:hypothetical protein